MAAAISALNAKIRSRPLLSYFCSTHFWGPASNFGIPIAAILDTQKDPELSVFSVMNVFRPISPDLSTASVGSCTLADMYGWTIEFPDTTQGVRFLQYWNYGGREEALKMKARTELQTAQQKGKAIIQQGEEKVMDMKDKITK
ncbi:MAG: hypothetical protein Q9222_000508 [Ikaeria aurantiellina]